jgi:hypothetical protein
MRSNTAAPSFHPKSPTNKAGDTVNLTEQLWDEITKSIAEKMPAQFLPLIKEEFGKEYPAGTSVTLLSTESITPPKKSDVHMSKILSDIVLLVDNQNLYHFECEVNLDNEMVVRMIEYDFHTALTHNLSLDDKQNFQLKFPQSVIMYPGTSPMPDSQKCTITFPDGFEYTYSVPIVKIQQYSLEEIEAKNLLVFIPFTLLRFAPQVTKSSKDGSDKPHDTLSEKELTDFVQQIIVMLSNEVNHGRLTATQFKDYIRLLQFAAERVFRKTPNHQKEVYRMTKSVLILPSDEMEMALAEKDSDLAKQATVIAEQATALAEKDSTIAEKDSIILQLQTEIQRLKKGKE